MDTKRFRYESIQTAKLFGVDVPATLPTLEAELKLRNPDETTSRILAMNAVSATAYGFDKVKANDWLKGEGLIKSLTDQERRFICEGVGQADRFRAQIEGMWALAWTMGVASELDFSKGCDNRFVMTLPNLKRGESCAGFRTRISPRPLEQVVAACDLAYCLHWVLRESDFSGKPFTGMLKPYVIVERRRALEWALSEATWDDLVLDT